MEPPQDTVPHEQGINRHPTHCQSENPAERRGYLFIRPALQEGSHLQLGLDPGAFNDEAGKQDHENQQDYPAIG